MPVPAGAGGGPPLGGPLGLNAGPIGLMGGPPLGGPLGIKAPPGAWGIRGGIWLCGGGPCGGGMPKGGGGILEGFWGFINDARPCNALGFCLKSILMALSICCCEFI